MNMQLLEAFEALPTKSFFGKHCIDQKVRVAFGKSSQGVRPSCLPIASRPVYDSFPKASRHFAGSETFSVRNTNSLPNTL
jgi:hypothetical protein